MRIIGENTMLETKSLNIFVPEDSDKYEREREREREVIKQTDRQRYRQAGS